MGHHLSRCHLLEDAHSPSWLRTSLCLSLSFRALTRAARLPTSCRRSFVQFSISATLLSDRSFVARCIVSPFLCSSFQTCFIFMYLLFWVNFEVNYMNFIQELGQAPSVISLFGKVLFSFQMKFGINFRIMWNSYIR